jgi:uncharacterized membrane protein YoaK (UPF0700 family)
LKKRPARITAAAVALQAAVVVAVVAVAVAEVVRRQAAREPHPVAEVTAAEVAVAPALAALEALTGRAAELSAFPPAL